MDQSQIGRGKIKIDRRDHVVFRSFIIKVVVKILQGQGVNTMGNISRKVTVNAIIAESLHASMIMVITQVDWEGAKPEEKKWNFHSRIADMNPIS